MTASSVLSWPLVLGPLVVCIVLKIQSQIFSAETLFLQSVVFFIRNEDHVFLLPCLLENDKMMSIFL